VIESRHGAIERHDLSTTDFLARLLAGELRHASCPTICTNTAHAIRAAASVKGVFVAAAGPRARGGVLLVTAFFMPWFSSQGLLLSGQFLHQFLSNPGDLRRLSARQ